MVGGQVKTSETKNKKFNGANICIALQYFVSEDKQCRINFGFNHLNLIALLFSLLVCLPISAAEILKGLVVGVHDGDTVTILITNNQQVKIRLAQIDAPEAAQAFGQRSRQSLSDMVFNKSVQVEKETVDKYGRTVGTVIVDGIDVNREQVKRGMAWVYRQYMHDESLMDVEDKARQSKVGLWSDQSQVPPWEYRHNGKKSQGIDIDTSSKIATTSPKLRFSCSEKRYCKEMTSCDEAKFYLTQCGLTQLDRDSDGIPCEKLCRSGK